MWAVLTAAALYGPVALLALDQGWGSSACGAASWG
jgi:hypothetical protein